MSDQPTTSDLFRGSSAPGTAPRTPSLETPPRPAGSQGSPVATASGASTGSGVSAGPRPKSPGQLVKEITEDFSTLVRKEIDLAKQEIGSSVAVKAKGAAIVAVGALFALFALIFLLLALRDGLDEFLWTWLADIVTAVILLVIGGIAVLVARKKLAAPISADLTKQTVKEDIEWAKTLGKR